MNMFLPVSKWLLSFPGLIPDNINDRIYVHVHNMRMRVPVYEIDIFKT